MQIIVTGTAEQVLEAILGPQQHDRHVQKRRFEQKMAARLERQAFAIANMHLTWAEIDALEQERK